MTDARKPRVLLVDDLWEQRDIHSTLLRFHGYEVVELDNGEAALQAAREQQPDLIIMDVMLPGLDGWTATRQLKADASTSQIPVLVLTARAFNLDRERSIGAGADAYLSKPCDPQEVLRVVQRLLQA